MNFWDGIFLEVFFLLFFDEFFCVFSFISFGVFLSQTLVLELADPT